MEKTYKFENENKWRKALEYQNHSRITVFNDKARGP